jgi:hypothetical protein
MPSVYPGAVDAFSDPLSNSPLSSPSHSQLHSDVNDALEKIETYVPRRNLLYNGAMQIHQRGTSTTGITTTNYYTADRWYSGVTTIGTWTNSIENDAPTGSGFRKSLRMLCTSADASPASSDELCVDQRLEGQDVQSICKGTSSAQSLTISFWVKANVTGTYIVMLYDLNNARFASRSYTISASATWEYKTITFPPDTTGAFNNDANGSLLVRFYLGAGSNATSGTLQTSWGSDTAANRAVGQVNVAAATNNYWQVTGVQMNVGAVAAPFQFKSYEQDLMECQRYYQRVNTFQNYGIVSNWGPAQTATTGLPVFAAAVPFRAAPGLTVDHANLAVSDIYSGASPVTNLVALNGFINASNVLLTATVASGLTIGRMYVLAGNNNANGYLGISAEL